MRIFKYLAIYLLLLVSADAWAQEKVYFMSSRFYLRDGARLVETEKENQRKIIYSPSIGLLTNITWEWYKKEKQRDKAMANFLPEDLHTYEGYESRDIKGEFNYETPVDGKEVCYIWAGNNFCKKVFWGEDNGFYYIIEFSSSVKPEIPNFFLSALSIKE